MTYIIALPCVDLLDKTCIDECPVDCIYEGDRMLYIHPDECVDCGACEPVCPVEAISFEADVPAQWKGFYRINVEFFEGIGSPGGASRVGRIGRGSPGRGRAAPAKVAGGHQAAGGPDFGSEPGQAGNQVIGGGMQRFAGHRVEGVEDEQRRGGVVA